jgi:hypothetical protein
MEIDPSFRTPGRSCPGNEIEFRGERETQEGENGTCSELREGCWEADDAYGCGLRSDSNRSPLAGFFFSSHPI